MKTTYQYIEAFAPPGFLNKPKQNGENGDIHVTKTLNGIDSVVWDKDKWRESTQEEHSKAIEVIKRRRKKQLPLRQ